jgi:quercetin dioxygenase-like cupin family protein
MKLSNLLLMTLLLFFGMTSVSCEQKPKETPPAPETPEVPAAPEATEIYTVDEAMNPLNVYKDKTKVFADSLNVQMYELILEPGDSLGLHSHLDHTIYVLEGGTGTIWVGGKEQKEVAFVAGQGWLSGPLTDAAKNTGDTRIRVLITEIFRPRMQ